MNRTAISSPSSRIAWILGSILIVILGGGLFIVGIRVLSPPMDSGAQPFRDQYRCLANLEQIGMAIETYRSTHQGKLPRDFAELFLDNNADLAAFYCPASQDKLPSEMSREALAAISPNRPAVLTFISVRPVPMRSSRTRVRVIIPTAGDTSCSQLIASNFSRLMSSGQ